MHHIVKTQNLPEIKALAILRALEQCAGSPRVAGLCKDTIGVNSLGPIVFVTPEFGRFSTVGGVGVMLDGTYILEMKEGELFLVIQLFFPHMNSFADFILQSLLAA